VYWYTLKKVYIVSITEGQMGDGLEKTAKILLLTHGGWGEALVKSVEMVLGTVDCVHEIALEPSYTLQDYLGMVADYAQTMTQDSIIMVDLLGGTPSNVAAVVGNRTGIRVATGLCSPMLLEACVQYSCTGTFDFDSVLSAGQNACKDLLAELEASRQNHEEV
jgi:D-glucosaminate-specific PTS system IIA component